MTKEAHCFPEPERNDWLIDWWNIANWWNPRSVLNCINKCLCILWREELLVHILIQWYPSLKLTVQETSCWSKSHPFKESQQVSVVWRSEQAYTILYWTWGFILVTSGSFCFLFHCGGFFASLWICIVFFSLFQEQFSYSCRSDKLSHGF